jgi:hypothetical protein
MRVVVMVVVLDNVVDFLLLTISANYPPSMKNSLETNTLFTISKLHQKLKYSEMSCRHTRNPNDAAQNNVQTELATATCLQQNRKRREDNSQNKKDDISGVHFIYL